MNSDNRSGRDRNGTTHETRQALRLCIYGRVQGVAYRASMQRAAAALGLMGWVRNRVDGSVEAVAEGDPAALTRLEHWASVGPSNARVERVLSEPVPACGFSAFSVLPTL